MGDPINWQCPHCQHKVTITDERRSSEAHFLSIDNADGKLALATEFRICPNPNCRKATLLAALTHWNYAQPDWQQQLTSPPIRSWSVIPSSNARPFPAYVPQPIREDYEEGCVIRYLSPKASATLARRALQGILRDFYSVTPGKLVNEIKQVKDKMDADLWDAIDAVRKIGNIGAHMEADINVIVDVDPNEAQVLLELVETMIEETYVRRADRQARLARVTQIAAEKDLDKKTPPGVKAGAQKPEASR
jgi:Domain of unknown function (DUF4145)